MGVGEGCSPALGGWAGLGWTGGTLPEEGQAGAALQGPTASELAPSHRGDPLEGPVLASPGRHPPPGQGRSALSSCDCPFSPRQDRTTSLAPETARFWAQPPLRAEVGAGGAPRGPEPEGRCGPTPCCPGAGPGATRLWPGVIRRHRATPQGCWPLVRCGSDPESLEEQSVLLGGPARPSWTDASSWGPWWPQGLPAC